MKSTIIYAIATLSGLFYVNHVTDNPVDIIEPVQIVTPSTQDLVEGTELYRKLDIIEDRQKEVTRTIKEVVKLKIIDSAMVPRDTVARKDSINHG